jgi:hypothetical protein
MEELINQIDEILANYEDWMHGVDGENCTIARSKLANLKKQLILHDVVGRSEQLFCHCKNPSKWTTDEGFIGCVKCNKEVNAK